MILRLSITDHAKRRYRQRWRPNMRQVDADAELAQQVARAVFVEMDGHDLIYRTPRGALLTVSNEGRGQGVVRTVLPMRAQPVIRRPRKGRRR